MKLLIFYIDNFSYQTNKKGLQIVDDLDEGREFEKSILAFIHSEEKDEECTSYVETKLVKNLKWAARKNNTNQIILHSFNHLSSSSAGPQITKQIFDNAEARLVNSGYSTFQTPFGYFLNIKLDAPGTPLARIFKEF